MEKIKLLNIDDDKDYRDFFKELAEPEFEIYSTDNFDEVVNILNKEEIYAIFLDIEMPHSGFSMMSELLKTGVDTPIIMLTGWDDVDTIARSIKAGAFHFCSKSINRESLKRILKKVEEHYRITKAEDPLLDENLGNSKSMRLLKEQIKYIASVNVPVLIQGEIGSGKNYFARLISRTTRKIKKNSLRPFIEYNTNEANETLAAATLFGHVKGAFTGATRDNLGLFGHAQGGGPVLR